jgi:hypothetical protein
VSRESKKDLTAETRRHREHPLLSFLFFSVSLWFVFS